MSTLVKCNAATFSTSSPPTSASRLPQCDTDTLLRVAFVESEILRPVRMVCETCTLLIVKSTQADIWTGAPTNEEFSICTLSAAAHDCKFEPIPTKYRPKMAVSRLLMCTLERMASEFPWRDGRNGTLPRMSTMMAFESVTLMLAKCRRGAMFVCTSSTRFKTMRGAPLTL